VAAPGPAPVAADPDRAGIRDDRHRFDVRRRRRQIGDDDVAAIGVIGSLAVRRDDAGRQRQHGDGTDDNLDYAHDDLLEMVAARRARR
jgi:hypothetical protein